MEKNVYSIISIPLNSILPHVEHDKYAELLALIDYTMANGQISELAIRNCLLIHPVVVMRGRHNNYLCIAGLRTLNMAKAILPLETEIQSICIGQTHPDHIRMMMSTDVFVTPLLFTVKRPQIIGIIYNSIPVQDIIRLLSDRIKTRGKFAKELGYAYNTLFTLRQKEQK